MRIKTKLLMIMYGVVALTIALVAAMYLKTSDMTTEIADMEAAGTVADLSKLVDMYFNGLGNVCKNAAPGVMGMLREDGSIDLPKLDALMAALADSNDNDFISSIYVGLESDGSLHIKDYDPGPEYDSRKRPWYMASAAARGLAITDPYVDTQTGNVVIANSMPLMDASGKLLGVLSAEAFAESLAANIRNARVVGAGFGVLLAADGTILEHPDRNYIIKENFTKASDNISPELAAIGRRMVAGESGWGDYTLHGSMRRVYYAPSKSGYIAGIVLEHAQLSSIVKRVTITQIITGIIAVILIVLCVPFVIRSITSPLAALQGSLDRMAELDLTYDESTKSLEINLGSQTELGKMALSLHRLRNSFTEALKRVRDGINRTASASHTLHNLSESASDSVSGSKLAVLNIRDSAQNALCAVQSTAGSVGEITNSVTMTASSATEAAEASDATSRLSSEVYDMVNHFVTDLKDAGKMSLDGSNQITELGSAVESITEFVSTIGNIAKQTNLLALNAAIEAARVGEAGLGFAVVADEVRNLAEESDQASKRVAEMIEHLTLGTHSAIESTRSTAEAITGIVTMAQDAQRNLKDTLHEVNRLNDAIQTIASVAEEQVASGNEISAMATNASRDMDNVANEIAEVVNLSEETSEAIRVVNSEAEDLSALSRELEKVIADFRIE
ncbi:MAG: methyl-accepting chemotaxis protein [Synergistaceae bacterium]|nr:methyl-accepting chemotaxis protein [Synergistaceae bacterium]